MGSREYRTGKQLLMPTRSRQLVGIASAFVLLGSSLLFSFRVDAPDLALAMSANSAQFLMACAAGLALGVAGACLPAARELRTHVSVYGVFMLVTAVTLVGLAVSLPALHAVILATLLGGVVLRLAPHLWGAATFANLCLALVLLFSFVLSVLNYGLASITPAPSGNIALWLLGDLSAASSSGWLTLAAGVVATSWLLAARDKQLPAMLLLGLAFGIAGLLCFVSWLAPMFARIVQASESPQHECTEYSLNEVLLSGLFGAAMVAFFNVAPSWVVGGYAPPLGVTIGAFAIPFVLWSNRLRLASLMSRPLMSKFEVALMIGGLALLTTLVVLAGRYAHSAA